MFLRSIREQKALIPFFVIGWILALFSIIGVSLHGLYVGIFGPIWIKSHHIGVWLSTVLLFFSLQCVYLTVKLPNNLRNKFLFIADIVYYSIVAIASFLITLFYGFADRPFGYFWGSFIVFVSLLNISIIVLRKKHLSRPIIKSEFQLNKFDSSVKISVQGNPKDEPVGCCSKVATFVNAFFKFLLLLICCLLAAGAIELGTGYIAYPARGNFINVKLNDNSGDSYRIHYLCDGPVNESLPVFIFDGSASHVMADYYGLQIVLKENNRRSCIFDIPGEGFSDFMRKGKENSSLYYDNMIKGFNESGPFVFVGWGGGGSTHFEYAARHPEMVHSLVFLDVAPFGIEFDTPCKLKEWTPEQCESNKKLDIRGRLALADLINYVGVPFGLMKIFVPPFKSYPPERREENRWFFLTDKSWITQTFFIRGLEKEKNVFDIYKVDSRIAIHRIMTVKSDDQIRNQTCKPRNLDFNSEECLYEIKANKYSIDLRRNIVENSGEIIECTDDECNLGYYIEKPQYTVEKLLELYKDVTIN